MDGALRLARRLPLARWRRSDARCRHLAGKRPKCVRASGSASAYPAGIVRRRRVLPGRPRRAASTNPRPSRRDAHPAPASAGPSRATSTDPPRPRRASRPWAVHRSGIRRSAARRVSGRRASTAHRPGRLRESVARASHPCPASASRGTATARAEVSARGKARRGPGSRSPHRRAGAAGCGPVRPGRRSTDPLRAFDRTATTGA